MILIVDRQQWPIQYLNQLSIYPLLSSLLFSSPVPSSPLPYPLFTLPPLLASSPFLLTSIPPSAPSHLPSPLQVPLGEGCWPNEQRHGGVAHPGLGPAGFLQDPTLWSLQGNEELLARHQSLPGNL